MDPGTGAVLISVCQAPCPVMSNSKIHQYVFGILTLISTSMLAVNNSSVDGQFMLSSFQPPEGNLVLLKYQLLRIHFIDQYTSTPYHYFDRKSSKPKSKRLL